MIPILYHGDYRATLAGLTWDTLITDAPYSGGTHTGHDVVSGDLRRPISYAAWTEDDVRACVEFAAPRTRGWIVSITDHALAPAWIAAIEEAGRYAFTPLPWVATGSRVRLTGDGPSSWTCWIVVARPRSPEFASWGTLPGAYFDRRGPHDLGIVGGKPIALMRALVRDYSRPGDVVCDPCAGDATTLIAARAEGRGAIGSEIDRETWERASERIRVGRQTNPGQTLLEIP